VRLIAGGSAVEIARYIGRSAEAQIHALIRGLPAVSIGDGAFSGFAPLHGTHVLLHQVSRAHIPFGVTRIGRGAFQGAALSAVEIPASVAHIGCYAFWGNRLESVFIPGGAASIGERAFAGAGLRDPGSPADWLLDEFAGGNRLSSAGFSEGVAYIGREAFAGNQLESVSLPGAAPGASGKARSR